MKLSKKDTVLGVIAVIFFGVAAWMFLGDPFEEDDDDSVSTVQTSTPTKKPNKSTVPKVKPKVKTTNRVVYKIPTIQKSLAAAKILEHNINGEEAMLYVRQVQSSRALKKTLEIVKLESQIAKENLEMAKSNKEIETLTGESAESKQVTQQVLLDDYFNKDKVVKEEDEDIVIYGAQSVNGVAYSTLSIGKKRYVKAVVGSKVGKLTIKDIDVTGSCVTFTDLSQVCM